MNKFYITTPIYYVNDNPHIGHAYTTVASDVLARWHRLLGEEVFFLTGTDEHGQKIFEAAKSRGREPKAYCDEIVGGFRTAWQRLKISNDGFIRTTDPAHENVVKKILDELYKRNEIYKAKYKGMYCVQCERFLTATELVEGLCPDHKVKPVEHSEENYFFRLGKYREKLIEIISDASRPEHFEVSPEGRKNEILGKLKIGLEDMSISRASVSWGIPLSFDGSQTTYVWVDALLNYISGIGYNSDNSDFNKLWPADVHLMAKDILWLHVVLWPAMLLAIGLPLPKKVYAHGFFTVNGQKMSKTIGNVIEPGKLIEKFGVDAARYLLLSAFPFGTDGDFSLEGLVEKYNSDLANNIGNLVARVMTMINKYTDGEIPEGGKNGSEAVLAEFRPIKGYFENLEFHRVVETIQKTANLANSYIEEKAPWNMAKTKSPELNGVLYNLCEIIWVMSHYLYPFMPETAENIWAKMGQKDRVTDSKYLLNGIIGLKRGKISSGREILFPRII